VTKPGALAPITAIAPIDDLLAAHADELGGDFAGYRNRALPGRQHLRRAVIGRPDDAAQDRHGRGAARHGELDRKVDYLSSVGLATAHLAQAVTVQF
jgi:hypothetical protein